MRRPLAWMATCTAVVLTLAVSTAHASDCTQREATAAADSVDHLDTWAKVDVAFRQYGRCDDGGIAEGNSEAVARLLVDHWQTLPRLDALIRKNPPLKAFVLRHIDSTLDTADLDKIKTLSLSSCPPAMARLCGALAAAASAAQK